MTVVVVQAEDLMEPMIVTASRVRETQAGAPYSLSVLTREELTEQNVRTVPDALRLTPGVLVQKTAHGHGSPFIRGFTGRQNLLLVDGVRVNNSTYRSGPVQYWNTVDPLSVARLEVIRSQGSVIHGSDAIGGTVNAISKASDFTEQTKGEVFTGGSAFYEFRSNGQGGHIGRIEGQTGVGGKWGVFLGLSAKDYGDIEDSALGRMRGTGYPEQDLDFRTDFKATENLTLSLAHQYVNQDEISRWHRTRANPGWTHGDHLAAPGKFTSNLYDQERSLTYLRALGTDDRADAAVNQWSATLSWQTTADSEFQNRNPDSDSIRRSHIDTDTLGLDLTLESEIGPGRMVYGFDFYHDEVSSSGSRTDSLQTSVSESLPIADDSDYDLFGAFGQYAWEATETLTITGGARWTYAAATLGRYADLKGAPQGPTDESWDSVVGSLRAVWNAAPQWDVFGGVSQAFRAPNLDDLSGNLSAKSGNAALGSTNVDPEDFVTFEVGSRFTSDCAGVQASVYQTFGDDIIAQVPLSATSSDTIAANANEGRSFGVELEGYWSFAEHWTLSGFAAWQETRVDEPLFLGGPSDDKPASRQLPLNGSLALRWTHPDAPIWLEGRVTAAAAEDRITLADQASDDQRIPTGGTPGYFVTSLRAGWQPWNHLELLAAVENISDEDYRIHGSGQNEPGLGAILSARLSW